MQAEFQGEIADQGSRGSRMLTFEPRCQTEVTVQIGNHPFQAGEEGFVFFQFGHPVSRKRSKHGNGITVMLIPEVGINSPQKTDGFNIPTPPYIVGYLQQGLQGFGQIGCHGKLLNGGHCMSPDPCRGFLQSVVLG